VAIVLSHVCGGGVDFGAIGIGEPGLAQTKNQSTIQSVERSSRGLPQLMDDIADQHDNEFGVVAKTKTVVIDNRDYP
jgi:hypothetical protein